MPYSSIEKRKDYHKIYIKEWNKNNKDKLREYSSKYDSKRKGTPKRKKQLREVRVRRHHRNKIWVLENYTDYCNYCGISIYEVLCVDHINNDGKEERQTELYKRTNCGGMWGFLANNKIINKERYQILCHNCNLAKEHYKLIPDKEGIINYKSFEYWKEMSRLKNGKK